MGVWTCGMPDGRREAAPADREEGVQLGLAVRPQSQGAGGQDSRGLSSLSRRAGKTQEAPVLHLSMALCTLEESAPLADTAGLPWLEESGGASRARYPSITSHSSPGLSSERVPLFLRPALEQQPPRWWVEKLDHSAPEDLDPTSLPPSPATLGLVGGGRVTCLS